MKIFLGWSGARSKAIANVIGAFVEALMPNSSIFFSPGDIDKGTQWRSAVSSELQDSDAGIWCLTARSLKSAWIPYEAGAISKAARPSRVCPVLFGFAPAQLPSPLADFHLTRFEKDDMWRLVKSLLEMDSTAPRLDLEKRHGVFDRLWGGLEREIDAILNSPSEDDTSIQRIQGHWWSKILLGPAAGAIGYVTIGFDPAGEVPYLVGHSYAPNGEEAAEWRSKGACVIERQAEIVFFYYWEGSHSSEVPAFIGSGEIRFSTAATPINSGKNFFTDTMLAEVPTSVIKKGVFRRATAAETAVMAANDARKVTLIQAKLVEHW